jgi:hypothetical protein
MRLSGVGYTPRYELRDATGALLDSAFVKLNVFPPGQRDYFMPAGYPHRVYVEVLPDAERTGNGLVNRSLNLVQPAVVTRVVRGRVDLGQAALMAGEQHEFEGLALSFPEIAYWGEFSVIQDPGVPILFVAFVLALAGLLLKLRGQRAEVMWMPGADGNPGLLQGWGRVNPPAGLTDRERGGA